MASRAHDANRWLLPGAVALLLALALFWVLADPADPDAAPRALDPASGDAASGPASTAPPGVAPPRADAPPTALDAPRVDPAGTAADDATLAVTVLHADGAPARGARVGLRADADGPWLVTATLGTDGRFVGEALDGGAEFVVVGATLEPAHFALEEARGEHTARLPEGAVLAGRVLIDGAPPGAPIPVSLSNDFGPNARLIARGFPAVGRAGLLVRAGHGAQLTDAEGRFRFSGLPHGERVGVSGPRFFLRHDDRSTDQPVKLPHENVLLDLARPASLFGRVVHADGTPAPDAVLDVSLSSERSTEPEAGSADWDTSGAQPMYQAGAGDKLEAGAPDADGAFELPLGNLMSYARVVSERDGDPPAVHGVTLHARCEHGSVSRVLDDVDVRRDQQLADLVLAEPVSAVLRVVTPDGAPIEGAFVIQEAPLYGRDEHRTDARGEVQLELGAEHFGPVTVFAVGFEAARVTPWGAAEQPVFVELRPAAGLTLVLRGPWSEAPDRDAGWLFRSNIVADDTPFQDRLLPSLDPSRRSVGPTVRRGHPAGTKLFGSVVDDEGRRVHQWTFTHGDVPYDDLRAHHPMRVWLELLACPPEFERVGDAPFFELDVWLEPGERRVLDVDVTSAVLRR